MKDSGWRPTHSPWLIAVAVMAATFMEILDTSVANVALPHIAGNLSASTEESTWVLTSYLVSNAIVLPITAWLGLYFGRKRMLVTGLVLVVFALLVYLQFRTWKSFDWAKFLQYRPDWHHILHGIIFIYLAYFLRAVRWKIFLRPVRKHTTVMNMVPPTIIGFTALALLGRPGELIRPYLVARRENLSFASQLAVWAVERIFDVGGFTVLMVAAIFLPSKLRAFAATRRRRCSR